MQLEFLDLIRCPYCGGRVGFVESAFHQRHGDDLLDGILGCHCCAFPVVAGIPVFHLEPAAHAARQYIDRGEPAQARHTLFGIADPARARAFEEALASPDVTYRQIADVLGPDFEGGYFLYRFSDPTYVVAQTVVDALAFASLGDGDRAIDVCGGSGHLTRTLAAHTRAPVLADLYFSKLWLAKRFTAPTCQPVCCDGNAPLPFRPGAFRLAVCSDAFHYIWTKRLLADEMIRLVGDDGVVTLTHVHNERQWNPSAGMPLPPEAYANMFRDLGGRVFPEQVLLDEVIAGGPLDLSATYPAAALDADPALTVVASRRPGIFERHQIALPRPPALRINPLYTTEPTADGVRCRLRFPSSDYADEYGACRKYLPDEISIARTVLDAIADGSQPDALADLVRRRVLLDIPDRYL